jgi:hypothetical protein
MSFRQVSGCFFKGNRLSASSTASSSAAAHLKQFKGEQPLPMPMRAAFGDPDHQSGARGQQFIRREYSAFSDRQIEPVLIPLAEKVPRRLYAGMSSFLHRISG